MKSRRVAVHLVHGTWPVSFLHSRFGLIPDPASPHWFRDDSPLSQRVRAALTGAGYEVCFTSPFWVGRNSDRSRTHGVRVLGEAIDSTQADMHVFVSHSHGANVALGAVKRLKQPELAKSVGLIAMAAPFASSAAPNLHPSEIALRAGALLFVMLLPLLLVAAWFSLDLSVAVAGLTVSLPLLLSDARIQSLADRARGSDWASKPLVPVVVVRAPADEATLALSLSDAVSRLGAHGWRMVRLLARLSQADRLVAWSGGRRLLGAAYLCGFLGWFALSERGSPADTAMELLFFLPFLPIGLIGLPALGLAMGLGAGWGLASFFARSSVEATPTDWSGTVHCLPLAIEEGEGGSGTRAILAHSLHAFPAVQALVASEVLRLVQEHGAGSGC